MSETGDFWGKGLEEVKVEGYTHFKCGDGDGGAVTRNRGKGIHNEISFEYGEYIFYILEITRVFWKYRFVVHERGHC